MPQKQQCPRQRVSYLIRVASLLSRPDQSIEERPGQHEAAEAVEDIAEPEVAPWRVEVSFGRAFSPEGEYENGDDEAADEVEEEAGVGLKP